MGKLDGLMDLVTFAKAAGKSLGKADDVGDLAKGASRAGNAGKGAGAGSYLPSSTTVAGGGLLSFFGYDYLTGNEASESVGKTAENLGEGVGNGFGNIGEGIGGGISALLLPMGLFLMLIMVFMVLKK